MLVRWQFTRNYMRTWQDLMIAFRVFALRSGILKKHFPTLFQLRQTPSIQQATDLYGIYDDSTLFRQPPPRSAHRFCPNLRPDDSAASQPMLGMLPDRSCSSPPQLTH